MSSNHPIIIRFFAPNHPIWISSLLRARSESTDNQPILREKSSDPTPEIVRNRQAGHSTRQITASIRNPRRPIAVFGFNAGCQKERGLSSPWHGGFETQNGGRTFLSAKRSGDIPVPRMAGWKTRPPVVDLSAEASAKAEAEARETDKALKEILEKLGV